MKLTIKWVASIVTILLLTVIFVETVPPTYKYSQVDVPGQSNLFEGKSDHQWSIEQLTRALLLALSTIVIIMAIWVSPERSWPGLYMERKRAEQRAKIAEAEAQIAKLKMDKARNITNP
ncbi:MAG: hypothetical protein KOO62_01435 [candidate division Zixibacteria bacterium]|nr:hypothetical protein [candidate division Zixibacteria bacterium]